MDLMHLEVYQTNLDWPFVYISIVDLHGRRHAQIYRSQQYISRDVKDLACGYGII